jgi:hypothetical protein
MAHHSRLFATAFDVPPADHDRELAFWQAVAGHPAAQHTEHPEYHVSRWPGHGDIRLIVQRLGAGEARVHLDIITDDMDAEIARLERLGAERAGAVDYWQVMRDPAGLFFCVVPAREPGTLTDENSQRWD